MESTKAQILQYCQDSLASSKSQKTKKRTNSNCIRVGEILKMFQFLGNLENQQDQKSTLFGVGLIAYCGACECCDNELNCEFTDYTTEPDDVVVGQHAKNYYGLTEVPYNFIASEAGTAFLNQFARNHGHFYGFREFKTSFSIFCTSDNKHITTENDFHITFSKSDGSYCGVNEILNYRPKICGVSSDYNDVCEQDWSLVLNRDNDYERMCTKTNYKKFGLFVKTSLYNEIVANCDLTAVR